MSTGSVDAQQDLLSNFSAGTVSPKQLNRCSLSAVAV